MKYLSKCPYPMKPPLPRKNPSCLPLLLFYLWMGSVFKWEKIMHVIEFDNYIEESAEDIELVD